MNSVDSLFTDWCRISEPSTVSLQLQSLGYQPWLLVLFWNNMLSWKSHVHMSIWQKWSIIIDDIHIFVVTVNEGRRDETGDRGDGGGILFSFFLVQILCGTESLQFPFEMDFLQLPPRTFRECYRFTKSIHPKKSNIDTNKNDGFEHVSPFKHGYFGYLCLISGTYSLLFNHIIAELQVCEDAH